MLTIDKTHIEFFAGVGGIAVGLKSWMTTWVNDICPMKADFYAQNHGDHIVCDDINNLEAIDIPTAALSSATYPCTNTSCAGDRTGLLGIKSGVVAKWLSLMRENGSSQTFPLAMLENPTGLLARNTGQDMRDLVNTLNDIGYSVCLVVVDALHFVPQSRPRIFINCIKRDIAHKHMKPITSENDIPACKNLFTNPLRKWITANLDLDLVAASFPSLPMRSIQLTDVIDTHYDGSRDWASPALTKELVDNLSPLQRERFDNIVRSTEVIVASVARRGRIQADGSSYNATEISLSGLAPAQRPYKGGSSRCWVLVAGKGNYRFKCVNPRESARLMGFDDSFILPSNAKQAYQCTGDSVCPQAVAWVDQAIFSPLFAAAGQRDVINMEQLALAL